MQHWRKKFQLAFRGIWLGIRGQSSFCVHIPAAILVPIAAYYLGCNGWQFSILGICIGLVLAMELMNSALELLAKGVCKQEDPDVGAALDIASGAVLVSSFASAIVGISIFVYQIWKLTGQRGF